MFLPPGVMTLGQFGSHVLYAQAFAGKQHNQVIKHVRALVDKAVVSSVCSLNYQLQCLFAVDKQILRISGIHSPQWDQSVMEASASLMSSDMSKLSFLGCFGIGVGPSSLTGGFLLKFSSAFGARAASCAASICSTCFMTSSTFILANKSENYSRIIICSCFKC